MYICVSLSRHLEKNGLGYYNIHTMYRYTKIGIEPQANSRGQRATSQRAKSQQPGTKSQEPRGKSQEPRANSQRPRYPDDEQS